MKIKVIYIEAEGHYTVLVGEQRIIVPRSVMAQLVSAIESAYQREKMRRAQVLVNAAKERIREAGHPDVLPFVEEKPFKHVKVRPDPPPKLQQDEVEPTDR